MCLIIYSQNAKLPPRHWFAEAAESNPDGIGIMSADGIAKFLGKRKTRRAWRYASQLAAERIPFAVHFRWATHGRVSRSNCHPFEIPGTGAHLMHNGVLWTSVSATEEVSDTRIFAEDIMPAYMSMAQQGAQDYLTALNREATGNRLLIMHPDGQRFDVINRHLWIESGGILYSNTYSIAALDFGSRWKGALASYGSKKAPAPSGPGSYLDDADDYGDFRETCEAELWENDYEEAVDNGFSSAEAMQFADLEADRREMATRSGRRVDSAPARSGFDWHDRSTWDKYPIPGTVHYPDAPLNRHGEAESPDDDGVNLYI